MGEVDDSAIAWGRERAIALLGIGAVIRILARGNPPWLPLLGFGVNVGGMTGIPYIATGSSECNVKIAVKCVFPKK